MHSVHYMSFRRVWSRFICFWFALAQEETCWHPAQRWDAEYAQITQGGEAVAASIEVVVEQGLGGSRRVDATLTIEVIFSFIT